VWASPPQHAPKLPLLVEVTPEDTVASAIEHFHRFGISQLPVISAGRVVGSLTENQLLQRLAAGEQLDGRKVVEWQGPPLPTLPETAPVREAYTLFMGGQMAVAVTQGDGKLRGVVSKSDLMEFWAQSGRNAAATKGDARA
jgi:cystathionine beta-synthase